VINKQTNKQTNNTKHSKVKDHLIKVNLRNPARQETRHWLLSCTLMPRIANGADCFQVCSRCV